MKRFSIVTEADARVLEYGSTVELVRGGHVTPLAADTRMRLWREHLLEANAAGLDDWRRLARESHAARRTGRRPPTRLAEIDASSYYVFGEGVVAPWHAARESA